MSQDKPLSGTRVVTLAVNLPGPLAASRLCALGATVTKIEPPTGDPLRAAAPGWYDELAEGQRVVVLDLKDAADRETADRELARADLLLTAMRPSALAGIGLDDLSAINPRLSHVEIVGHDGAAENLPGHDLTYQAVHGTLQPPANPTVPIADLLGAERAVTAALIALRVADASGLGHRERVVLERAAADAGAAVRYRLTGDGALLGGTLPAYRMCTRAPTVMWRWRHSSRTSGPARANSSAWTGRPKSSRRRSRPGPAVNGSSSRKSMTSHSPEPCNDLESRNHQGVVQ